MQEIFESTRDWFKERLTSPLYGVFVLSVVIWNWKFFYVLFWPTEGKVNISKLDYVEMYLDNSGFILHSLYFIIFPVISTFVIIWWLPILSNLAHAKYVKFYYAKKQIYDKEEIEYEKAKQGSLESLSQIKKGQAEAKKVIEKSLSQQDLWEKEFREFRGSMIAKNFDVLLDIIYNHGGFVLDTFANRRRIDAQTIAFFHTRDLIRLHQANRDIIELTDKGKFFAKLYLENKMRKETVSSLNEYPGDADDIGD